MTPEARERQTSNEPQGSPTGIGEAACRCSASCKCQAQERQGQGGSGCRAASVTKPKRDLKMPPTEQRKRSYRVAILGDSTARCEKCLTDCSEAIDGWVLSGLCGDCEAKAK